MDSAARSPAPRRLDQRVLDLSLNEVATFVALIDHGGFTAAARALHLSQPAVSSRVRRLEAALGCRLVDRSVRGIRLTREGSAFEPHARALLACIAHGRAAAQQVAQARCAPPLELARSAPRRAIGRPTCP